MQEFRRQDGSFFRRGYSAGTYVQTRRGYGMYLGFDRENRQQSDDVPLYRDYSTNTGFYWNQRTLFQGGGIDFNTGRAAGERNEFLSLRQGFLIARPFSINTSASRVVFGSETTTQLIATGTYRLDTMRSLSGRLIRQDGQSANAAQSIGIVRGTNLYFAYAQRSRRGTDFFLLLGDPNTPNTANQITLKVLRPY